MIDAQHLGPTALPADATRPFRKCLEQYEDIQPGWEARDAAFFQGRVKGQEQRVLVRVPMGSNQANQHARTLRDYRIVQCLRSTFVAKVLAVAATDDGPVVVYLDEGARPLGLVPRSSLSLSKLLKIAAAFADGLCDLHKEALIHGNLNLSNVWIGPEGHGLRISDFGLSLYPGVDAPTTLVEFERDPRFIAPEQTGRVLQFVDQRTDIYAFGVVLFWLISGQVPFAGNDLMSILDRQLTAAASFPAELHGRIPTPVMNLALKCLEKSSDDRYNSARGLRTDLIECLSQLESGGAIHDFALARYDPRATFQVPTRLYGREAETNTLRRFVQNQKSRRAIMLVAGNPGVGKTAFLNQIADIAAKQNWRFIAGKFDQYRRNVPYFSITQAFQPLIHQMLAQSKPQIDAYRAQILAACEGAASLIIDVMPEIELIIGKQPPVTGLPPLESRNRFNRIFRNLISALAAAQQAICLFMDDLQWADAASLELLQSLLSDVETRCLIFVAAYREAETSRQLEAMLERLEQSGVQCQRMILKELKLADVQQLVGDTTGRPAQEVLPLAELLHSRTQGNPLHLSQLLHFLYDQKILYFDYPAGRWYWDLERIRAEALTDDVLDLLRLRISALPADTKYILSVAACLGSPFEADRLAHAAAKADVVAALMRCIERDLLIAVGQLADKTTAIAALYRDNQFRFLHDRIQQAAFDLIPNADKKSFRLQIGRRLLVQLTAEQKTIPQIDVLNNFNYAWDLIRNRPEKQEISRLNLIAGSKARETLAYKEALGFLSTGMRLLGPEAWKEAPELAFELHANALECEYLSGGFARAEQLFALLLDKAATKLTKAKVYLNKILLDTSEERYENAIQVGIQALRLFGIRYRRHPGMLHLGSELMIARARSRGRRASALLTAATMTDPEKIAALKILVALFPTAYFLDPNLLMFSSLKVVNYSLRYGISHLSAGGFVLYGLVMAALLGKVRRGYEFGQLALELAERGQDRAVLCKVLVIFALFIKYWRDPLDESFPLIERARMLALQSGDHQYANYAIIGQLSLNFSRGLDLPAVRAYCERHEGFVRQSKDAFPIESLLMWQSSVLALTGHTHAAHSLTSASYDENTAEERYLRTHNLTLLCYQYTLRSQLCYLFGRHTEARAMSDRGAAFISSAPGQISVVDYYLYRGLAATATRIATTSGGPRLRRTARKCLSKLNSFAENSPQNFLPHAKLLEADLAFAAGDRARAMKLFNQVVDLAEQQKFQHLVALANERAALCALADGQRRAAAAYLIWARSAYARWGASAKVAMLDKEYRDVFKLAAADEPRQVAIPPPADRRGEFDVIAATATLQGTAVKQDKERGLAELLMRIRAQTGAQTAYLVVPSGDGYRVEAAAPGVESLVKPAEASKLGNRYSPAIVNYVVHTGTDLVIDNAHLDARFARCDYLVRCQPKSVMCAAIIKQSELLGIIYLEHRRLVGAFDHSKLQWLRILQSEVALALHAHKLGRYRDYIHRFTPQLAAKQIDADPDNPDLAAREMDVSILFIDLAGYTRLYELMGHQEADQFVNRAFSEFIAEIDRCHGAVLDFRGDELFVLFQGAEHGSHAVNAVTAALAIRQAAEHLNQARDSGQPAITANMGISSGAAVVGLQPVETTAGARWRYTATGMTVNIAARVRELARNGDILISAATAAWLDNTFECQGIGAHELKNVSTPIKILRLIGARAEALH
jgi:predicted ATPase/class 3 adenylate cyclase